MEIFSLVLLIIIAIMLVVILVMLFGMMSFLLRLAEAIRVIQQSSIETAEMMPVRQVPLEIID